jgi:hypothetical protein
MLGTPADRGQGGQFGDADLTGIEIHTMAKSRLRSLA